MSPRRVVALRPRYLRLLGVAVAVVAFAIIVGAACAGSRTHLAGGIEIDGVPVGGLTPQAADALLAARGERMAGVPVSFVAGAQRVAIPPDELGVGAEWADAVATAQTDSNGAAILQGFRRLELGLFGTDITPPAREYAAAVDYEVGLLAAKVDRPVRQARLVRRGTSFALVRGQAGLVLDRTAAASTIVSALASLGRGAAITLPVSVEQPTVTTAQLSSLAAQARLALSAPVTLLIGGRQLELTPAELAPMLDVGGSGLAIGGAAADAYFAGLQALVGRSAHGAGFAAAGDEVSLVPAQSGRALDVPVSALAVLAAAERSSGRVARLSVDTVTAGRTTTEARAMGITGLVGSYETDYGGVPNRIHNVELVAHLIDGKLIAPGATFSFNAATGARTAAKGFLVAPVIINGELSTGLGGGVCQVSTTVFNAAFVAGLLITDRTNHALYISHYPLGRDATVDYPDIDLRFVNDTPHWLLLRTFVGPSSLTVSLYGTPQHRRVVTQTAPLTATGKMPIGPRLDSALAPGERVVYSDGMPPTTTSVERWVYAPDGKLLSDETWVSNYDAVPEVVLVGPRRHIPSQSAKGAAGATTTATTTTAGTTSTGTTTATTTGTTAVTTSTTAAPTPSAPAPQFRSPP